MPRQVSWQSVATKSQPSVHGLGAEAAVAAEAPVGTTSAADASTPQEALPAAMITAAKNAELCIASLHGSTRTIVIGITLVASKYRRRMQWCQKIPVPVVAAPHSSQEGRRYAVASHEAEWSMGDRAQGQGSPLPTPRAWRFRVYDFNPLGGRGIR